MSLLRQSLLRRQQALCHYQISFTTTPSFHVSRLFDPPQSFPRTTCRKKFQTAPFSSLSLITTTSNAFSHNRHHHQTARNSVSVSTTSTVPQQEGNKTVDDVQKYLGVSSFPLGSLDADVGMKMVAVIEHLTDNTRSLSLVETELAFDLLDRLSLECAHSYQTTTATTTSTDQPKEFKLPLLSHLTSNDGSHAADLVLGVVHTWRQWHVTCNPTTSTSTLASPRQVLDKVRLWELRFFPSASIQTWNHNIAMSYTTVINVAAQTQDPELAEAILQYLESRSMSSTAATGLTVPNYPNALHVWNGAMDAWAKSQRPDAPLRTQAIFQKMMEWHLAGRSEVAPDITSYNTLLTAWADCCNTTTNNNSLAPDAPYRAEELLRDMQQRGIVPNHTSYAMVLAAWARCSSTDPKAPDRAYALLQQMIQLYDQQGVVQAKPNNYCYSAVISAYAKRGNVLVAERILQEQINRYSQQSNNNSGGDDDDDLSPDVTSFISVIQAWSKSGQTDAPLKAEALLQVMQDLADSLTSTGGKSRSLRPDVVSFTAVLLAWAQSGHVDAPRRCEEILKRMQQLYEDGYDDTQPNVVCFSIMLYCWAKSGQNDAGERAEAMLRHMAMLYESGTNPRVQPGVVSYTAVIDAWSRSSHPQAALRAQALYDELIQQWESTASGDGGDCCVDFKPTTKTYTSLISAWGRTRNKQGALRAHAIFDEAMARCAYGDDVQQSTDMTTTSGLVHGTMEPPARVLSSYTADFWSDETRKLQVLHNETIPTSFEDITAQVNNNIQAFETLIMESDANRSKKDTAVTQAGFSDSLALQPPSTLELKPIVVLYTALIDAWTKAGEAERAEEVLHEMESIGNAEVKSNAALYTTVIDAWFLSSHPDAAVRAQATYDEMQRKWKAGNLDLKPNVRTITALISTWGRQGTKGGATRAQSIFDSMKARCMKSRDPDIMPDANVFGAVIDAWAKVGAAEKAERILREMDSSKVFNIRPNARFYVTVIGAWSSCGNLDRAQALFQEMMQKSEAGDGSLNPDVETLNTLMLTWSRSMSTDGASAAQSIFDYILARYNTGDASMAPTIDTYNALILAWSKAGHANKAEHILRNMIFSSGIQPNSDSYTIVIDAWSRSGRHSRSRELYDELITKWEAGDPSLKPSAYTYTTIISSWGRSMHKDSAERAQALFDDMVTRYRRSGDAELKPNLFTCNALIYARAKANDAEGAEAILRALGSGDYVDIEPNYYSYGCVIKAWSISGATDRMQALYDELKQKYKKGNVSLEPTAHIYEMMIAAWTRKRPPSSDSIDNAMAIFNDMQTHCNIGKDAQLRQGLEKCKTILRIAKNAYDFSRE